MPKQEEWDALVATVANQQAMLNDIAEKLGALWLGLATGDVGPEITMSEENIEANAITANKINVGTLSAITANMGVLTAGNINMFTGTWDDDATGFRLTADEICGQNAGTDQVIIQASDGKLYAGGGECGADEDGYWIKAPASGDLQVVNKLRWIRADDSIAFEIFGIDEPTSDYSSGSLIAHGSAGAPDAIVILQAIGYDTGYHALKVVAETGGEVYVLIDHTTPQMYFGSALNAGIKKDGAGNLSFTDPNAGTATLKQLYGQKVVMGAPTELTIASGAITVTQSYHIVDTEGDAGTDDLDTINGGVDGMRLVLRSADNARDVTVVQDVAKNIRLDAPGNFTLDFRADRIELMYDADLSLWVELSRSDNA